MRLYSCRGQRYLKLSFFSRLLKSFVLASFLAAVCHYTTRAGWSHLLVILLSHKAGSNLINHLTYRIKHQISMQAPIQSKAAAPDKTTAHWLTNTAVLGLYVRGHDPCWPGLLHAPAAISWATKNSLSPSFSSERLQWPGLPWPSLRLSGLELC